MERKKKMEINRNLKIISIKNGALTTELPDELEYWILESLIQTNAWNASGSAFQSPKDFIMWLDLTNKQVSYESYVNKKMLKMEIINLLDTEENWSDYNFYLEVKGLAQ